MRRSPGAGAAVRSVPEEEAHRIPAAEEEGRRRAEERARRRVEGVDVHSLAAAVVVRREQEEEEAGRIVPAGEEVGRRAVGNRTAAGAAGRTGLGEGVAGSSHPEAGEALEIGQCLFGWPIWPAGAILTAVTLI